MPQPNNARFGQPQSLAQLTRGRGWNSELVGFLLPYARQDFLYIEDDFIGTLNADLWTLGTDAGSTAFAFNTGIENGVLRGVTEAASGDYILIKANLVGFDSARNPGCEIRWKEDVITAQKFEFGFCDPLTDDTLPALNDIDTPTITNGATDLVCIGRDTSQTLTTCALYADGTTGAAAKTDFLAAAVPAVAVYNTHLVGLAGANNGFGVIDNDPVNKAASVSQGPDSGTLVRPHFIVGSLAAAAITVDVDYIRIWAERQP